MKKTYMHPEAEKIQFNYRDQVVAASSAEINSEGYDAATCQAEDTLEYLFTLFGLGTCDWTIIP